MTFLPPLAYSVYVAPIKSNADLKKPNPITDFLIDTIQAGNGENVEIVNKVREFVKSNVSVNWATKDENSRYPGKYLTPFQLVLEHTHNVELIEYFFNLRAVVYNKLNAQGTANVQDLYANHSVATDDSRNSSPNKISMIR